MTSRRITPILPLLLALMLVAVMNMYRLN